MFERYTERALRTIFFARYEASQLGGSSIETEHVLLGLLRESGPLAGRIFVEANISYRGIRQQIDDPLTARPRIPTSVEMPFTESTKRVLQYAAAEADLLEHGQIDTYHLLLGLLCERDTIAERSLAQKGLSADRVREQVRGERVSPAHEPASCPSRVEGLAAVERVSEVLRQISRISPAEVTEYIESIELDLDLVRRAFNG